MSKILCIVPSKDRPAQLDLFLRSIRRFCEDVFKVVVIQKATNNNYKNGYKLVHRKHKNGVYGDVHVEFVDETSLREDVIHVLETNIFLSDNQYHCVGLFTDDSVFYRTFPGDDLSVEKFMEDNNVFAFSTRLGDNILWQKHWDPKLPINRPHQVEKELAGEKVNVWRVSEVGEHDDYGRSISPDGNIHRFDELYDFLVKNEWETLRDIDVIQLREFNTQMAAFKNSVLVNVPANVVHEGAADNWGKYHPHSEEELNKLWLMGNEIDLDNIVNQKVVSAHQEFNLLTQESGDWEEDDFNGDGGRGLTRV